VTSFSYLLFPFFKNPDAEYGVYDYATLSQSLARATAGQAYFFTVQVNMPGSPGQTNCDVQFSFGSQDFLTYG